MNPKNRFVRIVLMVRRASSNPVTTARRSPRIRVMSDASTATSVPVPMATPPSAPQAPPPPVCLEPLDPVHLVCRRHLGDHALDAHVLRHQLGGRLGVPG